MFVWVSSVLNTLIFINFIDDVTTLPLKEQNLHTRPNDYIMTIDEIYHGVHLDDEQKNYDATQSCRKCCGTDAQTEIMLQLCLLNVFPKLLSHSMANIFKVS